MRRVGRTRGRGAGREGCRLREGVPTRGGAARMDPRNAGNLSCNPHTLTREQVSSQGSAARDHFGRLQLGRPYN